MSTISEKLQIIKNSELAMKQAIIDKGGTINGDITTWANSIANIPTASKGDVTFYDYDGTVLHSFSKDEFLALNELPSLPTQPGLTCQGWNYDITNAKTYVEEYGVLDVGATYITDDGKTRLYIRITAEGRMDVPLYFSQTVANGVTIDWGDGSPTETLDGTGNLNTTHTYANIGDYCITITVASGCTLGLGNDTTTLCMIGRTTNGGQVYTNRLQKVEIGAGVTSIGDYAFSGCYALSSVVIPNSVTSIEDNAFSGCYALSSVVIPNSVTSIEDYAFSGCYALSSVVIPNSVTSIGIYAFHKCYLLPSVVIPSGVTSIKTYAFYACYTLSSIVIPNSVTSIETYAFYACYTLSSIVIPNSVTSIVNYVFYNCSSLYSIVIPSGVTSFGTHVFYGCTSLSSVVIPNSFTSIKHSMFRSCKSLSSIVIPNSVTSIEAYAFYDCHGMAFYDFSNHTSVPKLSNTSAFTSMPSDCKIVVPDSLYDTWITSTNWSTYSSNIIKKSDWDTL